MKATYKIKSSTTVDLHSAHGHFAGRIEAGEHTASDELPAWVLAAVVEQQDRTAREAAQVKPAKAAANNRPPKDEHPKIQEA